MSILITIKKLVFCALIGSLVSCGSDTGAGAGNLEATSIIGNWQTGCNVNPDPGDYESIIKIKINQNTIELITEYYGNSNNDCSQISEVNRHTHPYTISGNKIITTDAVAIFLTFHDPIDVTGANNINLCQLNSWVIGVEKDVLNRVCIPGFNFNAGEELVFSLSSNTLSLTDSFNNTITTTK